MRLTVIGCAGSYPTPESPASCYLIEHEGQSLVLDLGSGALGALQRHLDPVLDDGFAGVVLSHCHVDHCGDVASLYVMRHYGPARPSRRLPLLGPGEMATRVASIYGMADAAPLDQEFEVATLGGAPVTLGPFEVRSVRARHSVEAYSVRISAGGRSITYSGDTGPGSALAELARGTDIALFEASFVGEGNVANLHMTGADAARSAEAAGAGLLVLTHLVTWNDPHLPAREAAGQFSGPIETAHPGMTITL
jgi:ribonuclease BN (tRNA processing enzyme)